MKIPVISARACAVGYNEAVVQHGVFVVVQQKGIPVASMQPLLNAAGLKVIQL